MPQGDPSSLFSASFEEGSALPDALPADPMPLARAWLDEATARKVQPNPNAMTLATVDRGGRPAARIVLCRELNAQKGYAVFFTNYQSRKGQDLDAHPRAALVFHWDALDRQIRIEGPVVKSPAAESDAYFAGRSWDRRIGAWASDQSRPIASRRELENRVVEAVQRLRIDLARLAAGEDVAIPRPPHWGGFRVWAERVELWVGAAGRLHDRAAWTRSLTPADGDFSPGPWAATRLMP